MGGFPRVSVMLSVCFGGGPSRMAFDRIVANVREDVPSVTLRAGLAGCIGAIACTARMALSLSIVIMMIHPFRHLQGYTLFLHILYRKSVPKSNS